MKLFHINHDKTKLLIFFCGFYTDKDTFSEFDNCESDILFVYDYSDCDFSEISYFDFTPYTEINLIAYSYGVFAANESYKYLPHLDKTVAISGTIYPIHELYGIKSKVFDLMLNSFNEDVVKNFKAKMEMGSNGIIKETKRSIENLKEELVSIKKYVIENEIRENIEFDTIVLTKKDRIIPYQAQSLFYEGHKNKIELDVGHFPFFNFGDFDEIIDL